MIFINFFRKHPLYVLGIVIVASALSISMKGWPLGLYFIFSITFIILFSQVIADVMEFIVNEIWPPNEWYVYAFSLVIIFFIFVLPNLYAKENGVSRFFVLIFALAVAQALGRLLIAAQKKISSHESDDDKKNSG